MTSLALFNLEEEGIGSVAGAPLHSEREVLIAGDVQRKFFEN